MAFEVDSVLHVWMDGKGWSLVIIGHRSYESTFVMKWHLDGNHYYNFKFGDELIRHLHVLMVSKAMVGASVMVETKWKPILTGPELENKRTNQTDIVDLMHKGYGFAHHIQNLVL